MKDKKLNSSLAEKSWRKFVKLSGLQQNGLSNLKSQILIPFWTPF
jgi:hypothetical protein